MNTGNSAVSGLQPPSLLQRDVSCLFCAPSALINFSELQRPWHMKIQKVSANATFDLLSFFSLKSVGVSDAQECLFRSERQGVSLLRSLRLLICTPAGAGTQQVTG